MAIANRPSRTEGAPFAWSIIAQSLWGREERRFKELSCQAHARPAAHAEGDDQFIMLLDHYDAVGMVRLDGRLAFEHNRAALPSNRLLIQEDRKTICDVRRGKWEERPAAGGFRLGNTTDRLALESTPGAEQYADEKRRDDRNPQAEPSDFGSRGIHARTSAKAFDILVRFRPFGRRFASRACGRLQHALLPFNRL